MFPGFLGSQISLVGRATADLRMNYSIDGTSVRPAVVNTSQSAVGKVCSDIFSLSEESVADLTARVRLIGWSGSLEPRPTRP